MFSLFFILKRVCYKKESEKWILAIVDSETVQQEFIEAIQQVVR